MSNGADTETVKNAVPLADLSVIVGQVRVLMPDEETVLPLCDPDNTRRAGRPASAPRSSKAPQLPIAIEWGAVRPEGVTVKASCGNTVEAIH